jgi:hypothetical protein
MKYDVEQFSFGIDEYGAVLTSHSHQTLYWLNRNGYLNNEDTEMLLSRMVTVPVRNRPSLGARLLKRFFDKDSTENSYVFPITLLDDVYTTKDTKDEPDDHKPNLTVVK